MIYVDTSVLAAYYCPEPLSALAQRALQQERELALSPLVELEFVSAVARKVRGREMHVTGGRRIHATFEAHLNQGIYTRPALHGPHSVMAREWLATFRIPLRTPECPPRCSRCSRGRDRYDRRYRAGRGLPKVGVKARLITARG